MDEARVAIVTGGSRGIGRAIAEHLARVGMRVVVGYASDEISAHSVVSGIRQAGGSAFSVRADIANEGEVAEMFTVAGREYGGIDVVVNCAGKMVLAPIAEIDLDDLDEMHRVNIRGAIVVAREAARRVRSGGAVVGLSTSVIGTQLPAYGAYTASKSAVEGMAMIFAKEMRGRDVTVNVVAPGPTATELFLDGKTEAQVAAFAKLPPLERLATPADIARVVGFLTSEAGRWINGQVVRANGGLV